MPVGSVARFIAKSVDKLECLDTRIGVPSLRFVEFGTFIGIAMSTIHSEKIRKALLLFKQDAIIALPSGPFGNCDEWHQFATAATIFDGFDFAKSALEIVATMTHIHCALNVNVVANFVTHLRNGEFNRSVRGHCGSFDNGCERSECERSEVATMRASLAQVRMVVNGGEVESACESFLV